MKIGPYEVDPEPVARGGQGLLFHGYLPGLANPVAVKVISPSRNKSDEKKKIQRLQREVEALYRLAHPNAPEVLLADPDGEWFSMPLATHDLQQLLDAIRLPWQQLRAGLLGVADVVARAHSLHLVHRDLHPGNILIYPDRWSVADWGFVFDPSVERQTQQLQAFGVPFYIAPEIFRDPATVTPAADVFAIGRLAEAATGLGRDIAADDPAASWWRALVEGAGAVDDRHRWTMADVLAHLKSPLPMSRPVAVDDVPSLSSDEVCPNCGSPQGLDASCRCLRCHAFAY